MRLLYTLGVLFLGSGLGVAWASRDRAREWDRLAAEARRERARRADLEYGLMRERWANERLAAEVARLRVAALAAADLCDPAHADAARRAATRVAPAPAPEPERIRLAEPVPVPGGN